MFWIVSSQYRYLAYRSFVSWCWGFLGRRVRVVLPACVVLRIRAEFPDAQGQYVGFRPVLGWTATRNLRWHPACRVCHTVPRDLLGFSVSPSLPHMAQGRGRSSQRWGPTMHQHNLKCNKHKINVYTKMHYIQKALNCTLVNFLMFYFYTVTIYTFSLFKFYFEKHLYLLFIVICVF